MDIIHSGQQNEAQAPQSDTLLGVPPLQLHKMPLERGARVDICAPATTTLLRRITYERGHTTLSLNGSTKV